MIFARLVVLGCVFLANCASFELGNFSRSEIANLTPLLNSERIAHQFGSYGIEVIEQSAIARISDLHSGHGPSRTTRTIAWVEFLLPVESEIGDLHRCIVNGASLGATFKQAGWDVSKHEFRVGSIKSSALPSSLTTRMRISGAHLASLRYRLDVSKVEGKHFPYAWITEFYHPAYLKAKDVAALVDLDP